MVEILVQNLDGRRIYAETTRPLLFLLQEQRVDWMHACGGKGRCTTCKVRVVNGIGNTGPITSAESRYREKGLLGENERLACQMTILGDIEIVVPEECKLPHVRYSDDSTLS